MENLEKEVAQDFNMSDEEIQQMIEQLNKPEDNMKKYKIESRGGTAKWVKFEEKNKLGESLLIEMCKCEGEGKHFLGNLWAKHKYIEKPIKSYWMAHTYVTDKEGNCWGKYNVTENVIHSYATCDGKRECVELRPTINFLYIFEATEDVFEQILEDITERFYDCDNECRYTLKYKEDGKEKEIATWDLGSVLDAKDVVNRQGVELADIYENDELITWIG